MKDEQIRAQIHQAVDAHGEHLRTDPFLAQRIMNQERKGEPVVKKRLSVGLVLAIVLMLIAVTALAAVLLGGKDFVDQVMGSRCFCRDLIIDEECPVAVVKDLVCDLCYNAFSVVKLSIQMEVKIVHICLLYLSKVFLCSYN